MSNELEIELGSGKKTSDNEPLTLSDPRVRDLDVKSFIFPMLKPLIESWITEQLSGKLVTDLKTKGKAMLKTKMTTTPEVDKAVDLIVDYAVQEIAEYLVAKVSKIIGK